MDAIEIYEDGLMIKVWWPDADEPDRPPTTGLCGLLSCGHYTTPCHKASSTWDFPADPQACPEGCGERQFDLRLQAKITEDWY